MLTCMRAVGWTVLVLAAAGCHSGAVIGPRKAQHVPAPVSYTLARQGLPNGKIWKSQIKFGDVNGDGMADIAAVSRLADGPWVWISDGKGNWTEAGAGLPRETFCGGGTSFGDINKDGKMDIAIADHCKGVYAFFGDGNGRWTTASSGLPTVGSEDVALGDFNNDGCLDLAVVTAQEEGIRAYKGNCKGTWQESSNGLPLNEWGNGIVMADMNGDHNLDIVAAYSAGPRVYLGDGKGSWHEASEGLPAPEIHGLYWGVAVADINNDGKPDIATGAAIPGVEVFIQGEGGKFYNTSSTQCSGGANDGKFCESGADCPGGTCASSICKGTCTGGANNGKPCGTAAECPGGSCSQVTGLNAACGGDSGNACSGGQCVPVSNSHGVSAMNALGVALGDLDKDGNVDLVVSGKTALEEIGGVYGIHPFKGDGKGNFTFMEGTGLPATGLERTWGVGLADVNGDGVLDIGAALGDVLPPNWRSGAKKEGDQKDKEGKKDEKSHGPERGRYGSIEVWTGVLTGR